jgi:tyrosine-specific transport protein
LPLVLAVIVSAFQFHNIIPTVSHSLYNNKTATCKAIVLGVLTGFLINVIWMFIVLATLPETANTAQNILHTFHSGQPATIPMTQILHSTLFNIASLVFGTLAITASFVANGTGLFGFIRDLTNRYLKNDNTTFIAALVFIPPLLVTIIYPNIFLTALDIVGGIGETILFIVLPAIILFKIIKHWHGLKASVAKIVGYCMLLVGLFILIFIILEKLGLITYNL